MPKRPDPHQSELMESTNSREQRDNLPKGEITRQ